MYAITDEINGSKTLVVTNASGDEAIYGSVLLSRQAFATPLVSTYPNPVKETLFVTTNPNSGYVTIAILNNLGKHVLSLKSSELNQTVINVESLTSGLYFLRLTNDNGDVEVSKFLKL
ncbi:T9SS type A sorting domain-containing protein [Bizionia gelidisalsuginis]|uniref:T9SS type A sorting domain-containing protein n=1 Tax=Bizionia gelidisalsuginis TaxID=291188 RepID=UPI001478BF6D|nr:T9SS type A sorting domain-containing protein [Bizionia gelidisalsuginis]